MVNLNDPRCQRFINVIVSVILELAQRAAQTDGQQSRPASNPSFVPVELEKAGAETAQAPR